MSFADKFKFLLEKSGDTQVSFAKKSGLHVSHVNKFATGRAPNIEFLKHLLGIYPEVDLNWLLRDEYETEDVGMISRPPAPYLKPEYEKILELIEENLKELRSSMTQK